MYVFELQELEDATESFSPSRLIGKGSHGSVYGGILKDGRRVAVKRQSSGLQKLHDNTKLDNEALILSSVHPNPCIVNFVGISHDAAGSKIIITEHVSNGTLQHLLHSSAKPPPWRRRVEVALQVAKGLRWLHESNPQIVHRDVKSANILLDEDWNVKLGDFGLAAQLHGGAKERLPAGTIGYIDPSYTTPCKLSTKIDVFSYGVVLLELVSGRKAIDVSKTPSSIVEWAIPSIEDGRFTEICDKRVRLSLYTRHALRVMLSVAARCLSPEESSRPSMNDVVTDLERLTLEPIRQFPWSMNYVKDMLRCMMMRPKKSMCSGDEQQSGVGGGNISKGRLLIREILADITLN